MMNPVPWLQMTNMISYQGLVRTFPSASVLIPEAARVWMRQDERATKADDITRDGFQEFGDLKIKKI